MAWRNIVTCWHVIVGDVVLNRMLWINRISGDSCFHLEFSGMLHWHWYDLVHYYDVIVGALASQITSLTSVCSTVYSGSDQRKYQRSAPLAFVRGIHRKMFPFSDVIMDYSSCIEFSLIWYRHIMAPVLACHIRAKSFTNAIVLWILFASKCNKNFQKDGYENVVCKMWTVLFKTRNSRLQNFSHSAATLAHYLVHPIATRWLQWRLRVETGGVKNNTCMNLLLKDLLCSTG